MKHELKACGVDFRSKQHEYWLDDKQLHGITGTLISWLFPNTYANIPDYVLQRAAKHGSYVHACIEMSDIVGATPDCPESADYLRLMRENEMRCIAHEYIVSDNINFASAIDLVLEDKDGEIVLADIKTTSALHKDKVRAQLSIYAYLFELLNPNIKVKGLVEVWLPKTQYGESTWVDIKRTPSEDVKRTIEAFLAGESADDYTPLYCEQSTEVTTIPTECRAMIKAIADFERQARIIKEQQEQLKSAILIAMRDNRCEKWSTDDMVISYVKPSKRMSIDSSKLKGEFPEVYASCLKETQTSDSIRIKLN